ncbi:MAG: methyl-accepting chemotaxis protein [Caulobacteraceae bacterium]
MAKAEDDLRPERILELSERLSAVAGRRIGEISAVNRMAKMLSINALIVAARAGDAGKGFVVVAEEFRKISADIDAIAGSMESEVATDLGELSAVGGGHPGAHARPAADRPVAERHRDHRPQSV